MKMVHIERLDYTKAPARHQDHDLDGDAWAHYKREHDPPGTEIFGCGGVIDGEVVRGLKFRFGIVSDEVFHADRTAARAAAWDWYDRRHEMSVKMEREKLYIWPMCMMFSDEQVAEIERGLRGLDRAKERLAGVERRRRSMVQIREDERQNGLALCFTVAVTFGLAMPFGMLVSLAAWQQPVGLAAEPSAIASVLITAGLFSFVMSVWLGREMQEKRA